jgi:hypothetical protein
LIEHLDEATRILAAARTDLSGPIKEDVSVPAPRDAAGA